MRFPPILAALPAWLACHTADGVITPGEGVEFDCGSTLTAADASPPEGEVASQLSAYGAECGP